MKYIRNAWREELLAVSTDLPDAMSPNDAVVKLIAWPGCTNEANVWLTHSDVMLLVEYLKQAVSG